MRSYMMAAMAALTLTLGCGKPAAGTAPAASGSGTPRGVGHFERGPAIAAVEGESLVARYVKADDTLFERPLPAVGPWTRVTPRFSVALSPQSITLPMKTTGGVASVDVALVHNGRWLAVVMSWADATRSETNASDKFSDGVAVGFPVGDVASTSPFMGGPGKPMEINLWKALWQRDVERGYQDVKDLHPNVTQDSYLGYQRDPTRTGPASQDSIKEVLATPSARQSLPAIAIGNSMAQLDRVEPSEQLIAEGFGTLTTQATQDARAWGAHDGSRWVVVLTRRLDTGDGVDAKLAPGQPSGVSFAVWQGSDGDVGARKSYCVFTPLSIEAAP